MLTIVPPPNYSAVIEDSSEVAPLFVVDSKRLTGSLSAPEFLDCRVTYVK